MIKAPSRPVLLLLIALAAAGAGLAYAVQSRSAESVQVADLREHTHIHGLAVDARDPSRLLLATHHGFFLVMPDGVASRVSEKRDDFMGFTPHPADPATLYASGHPAGGGNLGFMSSSDGGKSWRQISKGAGGPVDFHQMDVSKADPKVIYGVYGDLQVSRDGGRNWQVVGLAPDGLIGLAASPRDANVVYAATRGGLLLSEDAGRTWRDAYFLRRPASMVETTADGAVYAFIVGVGLVRTEEPSLQWDALGAEFGDRVLLHLAVDPADANKVYASTQHSELLASVDGGRTWRPFGAS